MEWHSPILQEFMDAKDIQIVRGMSLSQTYKPDRLLWYYTTSGKYTVKSGYRLAKEMSLVEEWGPNCTALKAQAWKVRAPLKLQHFLWQIVSGSIAVYSGLIHRGVRCDNICQRCRVAEESINHVLFKCPSSLQTWEFSSIPLISGNFPTLSVFSNLDFFFWRLPSNLEEEHGYIFTWILWFLWKCRNKKVFQGIQTDPLDILNHVRSEQLAWEAAQVSPEEELEERDESRRSAQLIRCQTNGSWTSNNSFTGLGWICVQGDAHVLLLGAQCHRKSLSPLHSEVKVLIWAMKIILSRGIDCQELETDCAELVSVVQSPENWPAFYNLLEEFDMFQANFPFSPFQVYPVLVMFRLIV